jgi:Tol biopolymer transport system component
MKYLFALLVLLAVTPTANIVAQQQTVISILEILDITTGKRTTVKQFDSLIEAPNWTPDGKWLIYNSNGKLYKLSPDKPDTPTLIPTGFATNCNNDHVVSFDGNFIAISNSPVEDRRSRVYTVPVNGGVPRLVTPVGPSYLHGISPDGKTLAYCAERNGNYDIYTVNVEGGEEVRLTTAEDLDDGPEYSPDGNYIWFNSVRGGLMQVWRMKVDGSEQTQMTFDETRNSWFPHVSPDNKHVIFISYNKGDLKPNEHLANKNVELRLMSTNGGEPKTLVQLFGGQGTINVNSWAPDSKRLAFVSYKISNEPLFKQSGEVGNCQVKGSVNYDQTSNSYTVTGGGENMWNQADEFFMVWKKDSGNIAISSTLDFENNDGHPHKKMGLMLRASTADNDKYINVAVHGNGLTSLQYRTATGGLTKEITVLTKMANHITLARVGNMFSIQTAEKDNHNKAFAEIEVDFPGTYYAGLFVCAHAAGKKQTAHFSNLTYQKPATTTLHTSPGIVREGTVIYGSDGVTPAGIVFHYNPTTQHGYIVSLAETQLHWGENSVNLTGLADHVNANLANLELAGYANTLSTVAQLGTSTNYAARWCYELQAGGFNDWFLPSCGELNLLLNEKNAVNDALLKTGATQLSDDWHWASSEGNDTQAWNINLAGGDVYPADKDAVKYVRAIRKFSPLTTHTRREEK